MTGKTTGWVIKCYSGTNADAKIGNGRSLSICNDDISLTSVNLSMEKEDEEMEAIVVRGLFKSIH